MTHASVQVITELVPSPLLRACCGHNCGNYVQMPCPLPSDQPLEVSLRVFLEKARLEGWAIGLLGNICPAHVRKAQEQLPRITPASKLPPLPPGGSILTH